MSADGKPNLGPPLLFGANFQPIGRTGAKEAPASLEAGEAPLPKWKRFEALAETIQREFLPANAIVATNERIVGRISGVPRELDITVRVPVAEATMLLVVDCKDHARPVDVKAVEAFFGLLEDVGANKGAMISAMGFTEAARRRANAAGVDAWTLVDVDSIDWASYVTIPVLVERL